MKLLHFIQERRDQNFAIETTLRFISIGCRDIKIQSVHNA